MTSVSERDFRGHGGRLTKVRWPGGARVAVFFVVNFEEGAELSVSDGDERNEGAVMSSLEEVENCPRPLSKPPVTAGAGSATPR